MKKILIISAVMAILINVAAFGQESEKKETKKKVENTKKELSNVDKSIDKKKNAPAETYQDFKKDAAQRLKKIDKNIADISTRVQNMPEKDRDMYVIRVKDLKEKSKSLKEKLDDYDKKEKIPEDLKPLQEELQRDFKNLDKALNDFFIDNKK